MIYLFGLSAAITLQINRYRLQVDINYSENYKSEIKYILRTVEDNFFSTVFVMGITSIDTSTLVVIPTHMLKTFR